MCHLYKLLIIFYLVDKISVVYHVTKSTWLKSRGEERLLDSPVLDYDIYHHHLQTIPCLSRPWVKPLRFWSLGLASTVSLLLKASCTRVQVTQFLLRRLPRAVNNYVLFTFKQITSKSIFCQIVYWDWKKRIWKSVDWPSWKCYAYVNHLRAKASSSHVILAMLDLIISSPNNCSRGT